MQLKSICESEELNSLWFRHTIQQTTVLFFMYATKYMLTVYKTVDLVVHNAVLGITTSQHLALQPIVGTKWQMKIWLLA